MRALWYVPACAVWSLLVLPMVFLTNLVTWRKFSHRLINVFAPLWGRGLLWIFGIRLEVHDRHHLDNVPRPCVVIMNHESFLDMVSLAALNPRAMTALAKREFLRIPVLGQAMWAAGMVFIDRGKTDRAVARMKEAAASLHAPPRALIVFPEGTRSRSGQLQPFKAGFVHLAVDAGVPVLPLVIHGAYERQVPGSMRVVPGTVHITAKAPLDTSGWEKAHAHRHAEEVQALYETWVEEVSPAP